MATWHPGGGDREVLSQGHGTPRGSSVRVWGTAAVCLALGAVVGAQIDDALDDRRLAAQLESAAPVLSAGVIQENPDPVGDLRFAVPLHNGGSGEVTVESVTATGWVVPDGGSRAVKVPPDSWVMVPLLVQIDCGAIGATAPERLTVRSSTAQRTFQQTLPMPASSRILTDEGSRLCLPPSGSVPTTEDLFGTWLVEEAGKHLGTLVRLREDGTFAIDPDLFRFGTDLDALGTFTRSGPALRLSAQGGHDCRARDRTVWGLTLLEDGRLHIRHRPTRERWCGIEDGEVWVARRVPARTAPRSPPWLRP